MLCSAVSRSSVCLWTLILFQPSCWRLAAVLGVAVLLYDPTSATLWPHVWGVHGWFHACKVQIIATSLLMLSRRVFWVIGYICAHCSRGGLFRCSYAELHHAEMFLERAAVAQERRSSVSGLILGCSSLCASLPFRARYQAPVALRCIHCSMNMCECWVNEACCMKRFECSSRITKRSIRTSLSSSLHPCQTSQYSVSNCAAMNSNI